MWVKTHTVQGEGASVCLEWSDRKTGKYVSGYYLKNLRGNSDWTKLEQTFVANPDYYYSIALYLRPGTTGTAIFDDAFLYEENGGNWYTGLIMPIQEIIDCDNTATLELSSFVVGIFDYKQRRSPIYQAWVDIRKDGNSLFHTISPINNNRILIHPGKLPKGTMELHMKLLDTANCYILAEKNIPLQIIAGKQANRVSIDELGRTIVNGKPFMPIGLYTGQMSPTEIKMIANGGFNCVLSYNSMELKYPGKNGLEAIDAVMDCLAENRLKLIFSFTQVYPFEPYDSKWLKWQGYEGADRIIQAIVERWKSHPALLAWYICDELHTNRIKALLERRRLVNRLDPGHPTLSVLFQEENLQYYASGYDILGIDPYPIARADIQNMSEVLRFMKSARRVLCNSHNGMPLWTVPQIFNVGNYRPTADNNLKVYLTEFRYPTEEEIMSMCLLEAIFGSKGFIMYSYFDLLQGPDPNQFKKRWPQVCRIARNLRKLEPFILSDIPPEQLPVKTISGEVYAARFDDGHGAQRVLICGIGPGIAEAEITLPPGFHSLTGKTVNSNTGSYIFRGKNICSDILSKD